MAYRDKSITDKDIDKLAKMIRDKSTVDEIQLTFDCNAVYAVAIAIGYLRFNRKLSIKQISEKFNFDKKTVDYYIKTFNTTNGITYNGYMAKNRNHTKYEKSDTSKNGSSAENNADNAYLRNLHKLIKQCRAEGKDEEADKYAKQAHVFSIKKRYENIDAYRDDYVYKYNDDIDALKLRLGQDNVLHDDIGFHNEQPYRYMQELAGISKQKHKPLKNLLKYKDYTITAMYVYGDTDENIMNDLDNKYKRLNARITNSTFIDSLNRGICSDSYVYDEPYRIYDLMDTKVGMYLDFTIKRLHRFSTHDFENIFEPIHCKYLISPKYYISDGTDDLLKDIIGFENMTGISNAMASTIDGHYDLLDIDNNINKIIRSLCSIYNNSVKYSEAINPGLKNASGYNKVIALMCYGIRAIAREMKNKKNKKYKGIDINKFIQFSILVYWFMKMRNIIRNSLTYRSIVEYYGLQNLEKEILRDDYNSATRNIQ